MPLCVFVDSDVVISSLISSTGAAYFLLHERPEIDFFVSNYSIQELEAVCDRLSLNRDNLIKLLKLVQIIELKESLEDVKIQYKDYITDENDAHIVAGANTAHAQFLLSYNQKHFKAEKIKSAFSTILITPAMFLQFLRSK